MVWRRGVPDSTPSVGKSKAREVRRRRAGKGKRREQPLRRVWVRLSTLFLFLPHRWGRGKRNATRIKNINYKNRKRNIKKEKAKKAKLVAPEKRHVVGDTAHTQTTFNQNSTTNDSSEQFPPLQGRKRLPVSLRGLRGQRLELAHGIPERNLGCRLKPDTVSIYWLKWEPQASWYPFNINTSCLQLCGHMMETKEARDDTRITL